MQLTDEQIRNILGMHGALPLKDGSPDSIIEGREAVLILAIRSILSAHSAGAKGGPFDAMQHQTLLGYDVNGEAIFGTDPKALACAHPQPMPQTDAARDAKRYQWLRAQHEMQDTFEDSEGFTVRSPAESAWTVFRPGHVTSLEPVGCIPGELDSAIDAEIDRLDRAKGE